MQTEKYKDKIRGDRMEELRQELGISQEELARRIGLGQSSIHYLVKGTSQLSIGKFMALCKTLRASADYLLGLSDNPAPANADPTWLVLRTENEHMRRIMLGIYERVKQMPDADQLLMLAVAQKLYVHSTNAGQSPEAIEAAALIDALTPQHRAEALNAVYDVNARAGSDLTNQRDQIKYLRDLVQSETGIDVDALIAEKWGITLAGC